MQTDSVIDELLDRACPSIQYRLRREILSQPPSDGVMLHLQEQILQDDAVKAILATQQPDGWLGWSFHGTPGMEVGIRLLCEKGVEPTQPALAAALTALSRHPGRLDRGIGKVGALLDERGLGGARMIRAAVAAYAGAEDKSYVKQQIAAALQGFEAVLAVDAVDEIVEPYKDRLVFKPGVKWVSIYHLRLLAHTRRWRTRKNQALVAASIQRLVDLSPLPPIYLRHKSQWMAPASFAMLDFNPDMASMNAAAWMMWFHRFELLARLGVVSQIPELRQQLVRLSDMLTLSGGKFLYVLNHRSFKHWSAYTGLALERDWRSPERRVYDLTFRSLLILKHASAATFA